MALRDALRRAVGRGRSRRRIQRIGAIPEAQPHRAERAASVGADALPSLRFERLRDQSVQHADRRLQRRNRRPEAGRRRDGEGDGGRGIADDSHHWPEDPAPLPSGFDRRDRPPARRDRRARARSVSAQDPLHHLDAGLQPDEVGDRRRAGQALGAGACRRRDRRRKRGQRDDLQRHGVHARYGPGRMSARSGAQAVGDHRRAEGVGRRADVEPGVGRRTSARQGVSGRQSNLQRRRGRTKSTGCRGRSTTPFSTASFS